MLNEGIAGVILFCLILAAAILAMIFILVPLLKGIGWGIANVFKGIGWLIAHIFEFIFGMIGDAVRFVGAIIACIVFMPLVPMNIIIGRWSGASHFGNAVKREFLVGGKCLYRVILQRPLKLLMLHGLLEGLEQRVPEAVAGAPTSDKPSRRTGQYDGYEIVGSLKTGGSGAKLYIARPNRDHHPRFRDMPELVVIKSFAITEGSSLPQIVRESRALECAKQIGLVIDHGMDDNRFFYVMPYHQGEHLGIVTRQLHGETEGRGLEPKQLGQSMRIVQDLLATLGEYHRCGLWHKDVKPDNIIFNEQGAHLVDLGLVTPLRSAMTLTTHGTEYFRDPEMVRQALKGVKVHQVDGTRFDIYAVGAVLYFMLENTFPAHGALSRFSKKSPEALRWIVRRSMTDYDKRYRSAQECLADVKFVSMARDAFDVKPADLPSMRGGAVVIDEPAVDAEESRTYFAGSPQPKSPAAEESISGFGVAAGIGSQGPFAQIGQFQVNENGEPVRPAHADATPKRKRPKLRVTNWWTGAYAVDDFGAAPSPTPAAAAASAHAAAFRDQSREFRHKMQDVRAQVASGAISSRKAAREQIKEARRRAQEIQKRAAAHAKDLAHKRHTRLATKSPHAGVVWLGLISIVVVGGLGVMFFKLRRSSDLQQASASSVGAPTMVFPSREFASGLPIVVINRHPLAHDERVQSKLEKAVRQFRSDGYDVIQSEFAWSPELRGMLEDIIEDPEGPAADPLESFLDSHSLYGVLHVYDNDKPTDRGPGVAVKLWHSQRPDAEDRRWMPAPIEPAQGTFIVLNDLPGPQDDVTRNLVQNTLDSFRARGMTLVLGETTGDVDLEAAVRSVVPSGALEDDLAKPAVHAALLRHELSGLVRIATRRGDGPVAERIVFQVVPTSSEIAGSIEAAGSDEVEAVAEVDSTGPDTDAPTPPAAPTASSSPGISAATGEAMPVVLVLQSPGCFVHYTSCGR